MQWVHLPFQRGFPSEERKMSPRGHILSQRPQDVHVAPTWKARQAYAHRTEETPGVALGVAARGAAAHHHDHLPASPEGAPAKIVGDYAGDAPAVDRTDQDPPLLRDEGGIVPASHPLPKVGKPVVQRACQHSGDMGAVARSTPIQDHASSKPHLGTKKQAIPMFRPQPFLLE